MSSAFKTHISGRKLARSAVWNFSGMAAPLLVGLLTIPLLIDSFGKERFGMLAIIWMGVGYFSLFDMGLGRALTKLVAERRSGDQQRELGALIWSALFLIFGLGVVGAGVVVLGAEPLVKQVFNLDAEMADEAVLALRILAAGLPVVVATSALIGLLEAYQRFGTIAIVRVPLGMLAYVAPLATVQFTPSLAWATAALLAARLMALVAYAVAAAAACPQLKHAQWPDKAHVRPLVQFGGWLTVTNIVGPLMVYFDRFLIGALLSLVAVAYYVTPYDVLSRLELVPSTVLSVMFPAITLAFAADRQRLVRLYVQADQTLFFLMLPIISCFFLFGPEGLQYWVGEDFRNVATPVVHWLSLGWLVNTQARMPYITLQSAGRPDLTAKIHLLELAPYALVLWLLTQRFGIAGAAAAWFLRVLVDAIALNLTARSQIRELAGAVRNNLTLLGIALMGFGLAVLAEGLLTRALMLLIVIAVSVYFLRPVIWPLLRVQRKDDPISPSLDASGRISANTEREHQHKSLGAKWPEDGLEAVQECPICGSRERAALHEGLTDTVFFCAPGRWTLYRCADCNSGYLDPRPTPERIGLAYQSYYTHSTENIKTLGSKLRLHRRLKRALANDYRNARFGYGYQPALFGGRWLVPLFPGQRAVLDAEGRDLPRPWPGATLLDVGCGNGMFLAHARQVGWEAEGLDFDPVAVEGCKRRGLKVQLGGMELVSNRENAFDVITLSHVIEHVHAPLEMLAACRRVLKPNGLLWIETPNIEAAGHKIFGQSWRGLEPPRHLTLFSVKAMEQALNRTGFVKISMNHYRPLCLDIFTKSAAISAFGRRDGASETHGEVARLAKDAEDRAHAHVHEREFILVTAQKGAY